MIQQPLNLFLPSFASTWLHQFIFSSHFLRQSRSDSAEKENMMSQLEWWFGVVVARI